MVMHTEDIPCSASPSVRFVNEIDNYVGCCSWQMWRANVFHLIFCHESLATWLQWEIHLSYEHGKWTDIHHILSVCGNIPSSWWRCLRSLTIPFHSAYIINVQIALFEMVIPYNKVIDVTFFDINPHKYTNMSQINHRDRNEVRVTTVRPVFDWSNQIFLLCSVVLYKPGLIWSIYLFSKEAAYAESRNLIFPPILILQIYYFYR